MVCPACHDTGYEAESEDEVTPCTHPDHHASEMARQFAADPRFAHLNKPAAWWDDLLDQDERNKSEGAYMWRLA